MRAGSTELLLMLQDFLEVGIWVWEPESGALYWDSVLHKLYGVPTDVPVTYDLWARLVNPDDLAYTVAQAQRLLAKEIGSYDHRFEATRPNGEMLTIRTVAKLFEPPNRPRYVMGCNVDVSASKGVENKLALALDVTGIGIWDLDVKRNVLVWDDAMFRLYGVPRDRFGNAYEAWEACVHPEDRERARVDVRDALAGTRDFDTTFRVIGPVGEERWIRARGKVFFDAERAPVRMLGANMDISADMERARLEEEQRKINDHQAKLATIGELAAGVGHEINNPLAIILAGLELMQSRLARGDLSPELMADLIAKQRLAAERIKNITVGLRDYARAEGDEPVEFNVVEAVGQTLLLVKELYGVAGIELVRDFADGPLWVRGHSGQIQQVLLNLLSNAKAAMAGRKDKRIVLSIRAGDGECRISVADNGHGIPDRLRDKIFQKFFTTKENGHGTGMGLSISRSLCERHRGSLEFETGPEGTVFTCRLPLVKPDSREG